MSNQKSLVAKVFVNFLLIDMDLDFVQNGAHISQTGPGRGPYVNHARGASGQPFHRLSLPFGLSNRPVKRILVTDYTFSRKDSERRRHQALVLGVRRSYFGTLPRRGLTPGAISFEYAASMMLRE